MKKNRFYILNGKEIVGTDDVLVWGRFIATPEKIIKQDDINGVHVSTVFLGIDHSWGNGAPILFETMVFGGVLDSYQRRYSTYEQAEAGHILACEEVIKMLQ